MTRLLAKIDLPITCDEDLQVQHLLENCDLNEAFAIYQRLKPDLGGILNAIGALYIEKKGDYHSAIDYYNMALKIQEKNNEDISSTLTEIGFAHQNLHEFDSALLYHFRALTLRQLSDNIDPKLVAINLLGIANAYWDQQDLSEALIYAQKALTLNQSIASGNESNIAANLAVLANISLYSGDDIHALELIKRALALVEHNYPSTDSPSLVLLLNNVGVIQVSAGLFDDALLTFIRVLHICQRTLPEGHSNRIIVENNVKRIADMQKNNVMNSFSQFWNTVTQFLLF